MAQAQKAVEEMFSAALSLKGTLTGEHGIGNTKSRFIHWEVGAVELELMKGLKHFFDPKGTLNPGKIFPE
jgi:FAD/FMN-containing dehydrogenase